MPMGQMPVLEVDGFRVHQSISMARYLAKRVGLAGANEWENLLIDTAVDTVNDFRLSEYFVMLVCSIEIFPPLQFHIIYYILQSSELMLRCYWFRLH